MGNRPIRRRPFRRPPWKSKSRPIRWAATTPGLGANSGLQSYDLQKPEDPAPPLVELIAGPDDVQPWSDDQEITVDRVVGDISVYVSNTYEGDAQGQWDIANPLYRFGLLLVEEAEPPSIDLWDLESLEDLEWMWLTQGTTDTARNGQWVSTADALAVSWTTFHVDIKNRRKCGFNDRLCLYGGAALPIGPVATLTWGAVATPLLRVVMMGR